MQPIHYLPEELIGLVAQLAAREKGVDSTSISYEKAQDLMAAVLYCIAQYEQCGAMQPVRTTVSAKEAYRVGYQMVLDKLEQLRTLHNRLLPAFQSYGLLCLEDLMYKGIPQFLQRYDARYRPQHTLLTLDYPLLMDCSSLCGVEAVLAYLRCVALEQQFLQKFAPEYITQLLSAYHSDYPFLIENICSIVLQNLLGHLLLQKPLSRQGFDSAEQHILRRQYSRYDRQTMTAFVETQIASLIAQFYNEDEPLQGYLQHEAANIAVRICNGIEHNYLENVFWL